jgi:hypothetical protein
MKGLLQVLDQVLRGEATSLAKLRQGRFDIPLGPLLLAIVVLGLIGGMGLGSYALFRSTGRSIPQFFASAVKVPLLFILTVVVTFPSLYVFNALVGSRLSMLSILRLIVACLAVTLAVLASFAPIVAFFAVSTTSYHFMVLLNVALCAISGFLGLSFLLQTLHRLTIASEPIPTEPPPTPPGQPPVIPNAATGALDPTEGRVPARHVRAVFRWWIILFAVVGAQMGWVLRPFIGDPALRFTFFRARESNFFQAVWQHFISLFQ